MARSFADPAKAEENFQFLDQLKDANIWKILMNLVDPNTSFHQARTLRVRINICIDSTIFIISMEVKSGENSLGTGLNFAICTQSIH